MQTRIQGADEAYQRGNAYYREGRRDKAAGLYRKAVGLFPKCVYVLMFVFWMGTDWSSTFGQLSTHTPIYTYTLNNHPSIKQPRVRLVEPWDGAAGVGRAGGVRGGARAGGFVCICMYVCLSSIGLNI